jgi:hypothetical protein
MDEEFSLGLMALCTRASFEMERCMARGSSQISMVINMKAGGIGIAPLDLGPSPRFLVMAMKAIGKTTCTMAKVSKYGVMVINTRGTSASAKRLAKVSTSYQMVAYTRVNGFMIRFMALVNIPGHRLKPLLQTRKTRQKASDNTEVSGKKTNFMVMPTIRLEGKIIEASMNQISRMGLEYINGKMIRSMKASGLMANNMVMAAIPILKIKVSVEFGKMVN